MSMMNTLIIFAIVAWLLQIILGWWQINRFNQAFAKLSAKGNVGIGRTPGRFKAKVVIALAFDEHLTVVDSLIMKGLSVFAVPKTVESLIGLSLQHIQPQAIFPDDKNAQDALAQAIQIKD
ncbi:transcriptional regulator GutM [Lonepinella sp. BR2882]|uniref:transcriptional regulator GutM n=1 Tax=Lonepinella sp. BR2882 TaxID=3095283 RepID=UPI003F6DACAB